MRILEANRKSINAINKTHHAPTPAAARNSLYRAPAASNSGDYFIPEIISGASVDTFKVNNISAFVHYRNRRQSQMLIASGDEDVYNKWDVPSGYTGILYCFLLGYYKLDGYSLNIRIPNQRIVLSTNSPGLEYPNKLIFTLTCSNGRITNIVRQVSQYCPCDIFDNASYLSGTFRFTAFAVNEFSLTSTIYLVFGGVQDNFYSFEGFNGYLTDIKFIDGFIQRPKIIVETNGQYIGWKENTYATLASVYSGSATTDTPNYMLAMWSTSAECPEYGFHNPVGTFDSIMPFITPYGKI